MTKSDRDVSGARRRSRRGAQAGQRGDQHRHRRGHEAKGETVAELARRAGAEASSYPPTSPTWRASAPWSELLSNASTDHLSNNAGVTRTQQFFDVNEDDWESVNRINARRSFFRLQAVARHMVQNGSGSIANTASIASLGYRETTTVAYSASKGAMLTMGLLHE